jgi:hypothetical protein
MSDLELTMMSRVGELNKENARLKAEVERLDTLCKQVMAQHSDISCENIMLRKANDELAKAGDLMLKYACANVTYPCYATMAKDWNAAKEGKQS